VNVTFERITVSTEAMGGMPCIRGLRIPVATVVAMVADGMTVTEILDELPDLTPKMWPRRCATPPRQCASASCPCATLYESFSMRTS